MNKFFKPFLALLVPLFAVSITACAEQYTEGKQYTKVNETISTKKEVREYFSVYCGHCFKFEPFMHDLKKSLPDGTTFERNHVDFLPGASPKIQQILTKATVVAEQFDNTDKLIGALFNYIHVQRAVITSEKDVRNIFVLNGADGEKFDKLMKSFSVNSQTNLLKKKQENMSAKRALTGVPTIIVNGKYRVNPKELDTSNFQEDYKNLVKHLLTLD
ncbi:thiol:disulfide interchange protein DsbA/DsbL [Colwellia sp. D2M02]|uniref:thiol:disulfide interchange protein DsbA/DsbL n=1 Tax=Colwellia sp. D2M02 TaxID=2841562 RepID=UPI001C090FB0|nr:thiol:disulfide interchange protein DsbA/DsbL [Colwellia sp. D2M02]MBU2893625.1 thiol:disulfide interchange protein DsbA/DsbL [Colwellia sp. D2M02]